MSPTPLHYDLHEGFVHSWLVMGPYALPMHTDGGAPSWLDSDPVVATEPAEPATPEDHIALPADRKGIWRYVRCPEDHAVYLSGQADEGEILHAWAYVAIEASSAFEVVLALTARENEPSAGGTTVDLWVNRQRVDPQPSRDAGTRCYAVQLVPGANAALLRVAMMSGRTGACALALQVLRPGAEATPVSVDDVTVSIPTRITPVERRDLLEGVFSAAYADRYVVTRDEEFTLHWPTYDEAGAFEGSTNLTARLRTPEGRIYAETDGIGTVGGRIKLGRAYQHPSGPLEAILMPRPTEYYEGNMRITREFSLWGLNNRRFTEAPSGEFGERRLEALKHIARRELGVYSEMAKMAIGLWSYVDARVITKAIAGLETGRGDTHGDLLGLLSLVKRYSEAPGFPDEAFAPLETAVSRVDFDGGGHGDARMESRELLVATSELIAGQRYPALAFERSGKPGAWHCARGEQRALAWMQARARGGLREWNSDLVFEETLLALSCLIDFAEAEAVWQAATVLMDKLLFQLALNSFKGVFGSSRGRTSAESLLGGYLEATSGISKLMFGTGVVNDTVRATVSLACMQEYELPVMLQRIAAELPVEGIRNQEHHAGDDGNGVNLVSYKAPEFMLSSAQDYRPGERGSHEHIWQATLGPGATVFVTHPGCSSLDPSWRPNFWLGNGVLPRVAQWSDALIALYALPENDWMGYTHAYFPVHAFDAYVLREGWAFARRGDGFLALSATEGLTLVRSGDAAYRELRSSGLRNAWICQMGSAALDGDFAAFQDSVLALPRSVDGLKVRWTTLRGDALEFDRQGPLLRNGEAVPLSFGPHLDSPYCVADFPASVMDIRVDDVVMRLTLVED